MNDAPLPRPTLVTALEERLRADLEGGRYRPGDLLPPERDLAAQHGVARATVKQALARMEQLGLIETRHGVGSRVRSPDEGAGSSMLRWLVGLGDPRWIDDLFEARRLFGPLVARQAAAHANADDRERLESLLAELERAEGAERVHAIENEIHRVLARASNNRILRLLVDGMIKGYAPARSGPSFAR
jgi:DNA-binding FadR family transcriptional regulator